MYGYSRVAIGGPGVGGLGQAGITTDFARDLMYQTFSIWDNYNANRITHDVATAALKYMDTVRYQAWQAGTLDEKENMVIINAMASLPVNWKEVKGPGVPLPFYPPAPAAAAAAGAAIASWIPAHKGAVLLGLAALVGAPLLWVRVRKRRGRAVT